MDKKNGEDHMQVYRSTWRLTFYKLLERHIWVLALLRHPVVLITLNQTIESFESYRHKVTTFHFRCRNVLRSLHMLLSHLRKHSIITLPWFGTVWLRIELGCRKAIVLKNSAERLSRGLDAACFKATFPSED